MASRNHLLIDGDILLYQTTRSCLQEADWGDNLVNCWMDLGELKHLLHTIITKLQEELNADSYTFCLSDYEWNFRKDLEPTYKEQRDGSGKPLGYMRAHEWVQREHPCEKLPGLEADDVMGILATCGQYPKPIIVSDDKDMRQVPGKLYVPRRKELLHITREDGFRYHMHQTLVGDRVDNYFGCPGVGEVRAAKALDGKAPSELWDAVVSCYVHAKQTPEDAIHQARLAKILQAEDYDDQQGVKLWEPPVSTVAASHIVVLKNTNTTSASKPTDSSTKPSTSNSETTPTMISRKPLLRGGRS